MPTAGESGLLDDFAHQESRNTGPKAVISMNRAFAIIFLSNMAGCASEGVYQASEGTDNPTIKFQGQYSLLLMYKNGEDCSNAVGIPEKYAPWTPQNLPMPVNPDVVTSFQVRQYDVTIVSGRAASATCGGIFSFSPKRNTDYLFSFRDEGENCSTLFLEKDRADAGSRFTASPIMQREEKFAMTLKGSVCEDIPTSAVRGGTSESDSDNE